MFPHNIFPSRGLPGSEGDMGAAAFPKDDRTIKEIEALTLMVKTAIANTSR
jgi:hypothetical protein